MTSEELKHLTEIRDFLSKKMEDLEKLKKKRVPRDYWLVVDRLTDAIMYTTHYDPILLDNEYAIHTREVVDES